MKETASAIQLGVAADFFNGARQPQASENFDWLAGGFKVRLKTNNARDHIGH
jgi:hypothetical protein